MAEKKTKPRAKPKAKPKRRGRPTAEIDQKQFENLCKLQCTETEFCAWFEVDDKTLGEWCKRTYGKNFSDVFSEKRGLGKISLRRTQFQLAEKSPAMAIFLGKQYLDQTEESAAEIEAREHALDWQKAIIEIANKRAKE